MRDGVGSVVSALSLVLAACASTPSPGAGSASTSPRPGPPTTLAALLAIYRDSTPLPPTLPRCRLPDVTLGTDSATAAGADGGLRLELPAGWHALRPRAPSAGLPETVLEDSAGSRISIRPVPYRTGRPFFAKRAADESVAELPHAEPCQVADGPAGSIWTLYPPDSGAAPRQLAAYNALGDLITPAGKRYGIRLTAPSAERLDRIVRIVTLARDLPPERPTPPSAYRRPGTTAASVESRACARAEGTVVIRGVVRDTSGAPIPGAMVFVSTPPVVATTDAKGRYELTVRAGPIPLRAQMIGYHRRAVDTCADRRTGRVLIINFELEPQPGMIVH